MILPGIKSELSVKGKVPDEGSPSANTIAASEIEFTLCAMFNDSTWYASFIGFPLIITAKESSGSAIANGDGAVMTNNWFRQDINSV